ncbi:MAG: protein kinase [Deltaproteobacteria bacterium]|nr:protein kinase [Deltaproteobacteria bacterium]
MTSDDDTVLGTLASPGVAPPVKDEEPPALVAGRYQIVRWLGGGGMGRVYEAVDAELGERVALKMLRGGMSEEAIQRFRREVRLTRRIQHRNVARMYDIGEHDGEKFLTMELVDGESLTRRVGTPMPWPELRDLALQLCAGLEAAHATGVVHRDLKPDNVLVERATRRAVITDFGIARGADDASVTQVGMVVGTPRYMAPEQLAGTEIDGRADVFALGVMLYELASGTRPWSGDSAVAIAVAQATRTARPLRAALPRAAIAAIETCIAIDRAARPGNAGAVAALRRRHDRPVRALPAPRAAASIAHSHTEPAQPMPARTPPPTPTPMPSLIAPRGQPPTTLAVVPFRAADADAPLALTVREDLIDILSTTPNILVRPAAASERGETDPREIGRALGVDVVVVGAIRRAPASLRISARLIGVTDGFQIGAHHADGTDVDVLALVDRLGHQVAETVSARASERSAAERPTDPRAVELYLAARTELRKFWANHAVRAVELLERAVELAPASPQVLGAYALAAVHLWVRSPDPVALQRAERAVERAHAVGHPEALLAAGMLALNRGDLDGAVAGIGGALVRAPMLGTAHEYAARILIEVGAIADARNHFGIATALDPGRAQLIDVDLSRADALDGDWDGAHRRATALGASSEPAFAFMGAMTLARLACWRRDREELLAMGSRLRPHLHNDPTGIAKFLFTYFEEHRVDAPELEAAIGRVDDPNRPRRPALIGLQRIAEVAAFVDRADLALAALRSADGVGLLDVVWLDRCPILDGLRADPAFTAVRNRVAARAARVLTAFRTVTA